MRALQPMRRPAPATETTGSLTRFLVLPDIVPPHQRIALHLPRSFGREDDRVGSAIPCTWSHPRENRAQPPRGRARSEHATYPRTVWGLSNPNRKKISEEPRRGERFSSFQGLGRSREGPRHRTPEHHSGSSPCPNKPLTHRARSRLDEAPHQASPGEPQVEPLLEVLYGHAHFHARPFRYRSRPRGHDCHAASP